MASNIPADLRYTLHDEWVRPLGGGLVAVGITDFAQDALGEIVHVELPSVGDAVAAGKAIAEIESVKAVAEIYAPVSGEITEINEHVGDNPDAVNGDAYGSWLFKVKLANEAELSALLDAAGYQKKLDEA